MNFKMTVYRSINPHIYASVHVPELQALQLWFSGRGCDPGSYAVLTECRKACLCISYGRQTGVWSRVFYSKYKPH